MSKIRCISGKEGKETRLSLDGAFPLKEVILLWLDADPLDRSSIVRNQLSKARRQQYSNRIGRDVREFLRLKKLARVGYQTH